jgi:hypothetical protein
VDTFQKSEGCPLQRGFTVYKFFNILFSSRDDWFVLYGALHSKGYVLTSDILRKERGITNKSTPAKNISVNDKLQKWLYRYQYMFIRQGNRVYFKVNSQEDFY